ncbi:MAG TPA: hypothetical protein VHB53_07500 [Solirubrobacterales bacterium]|nr:hypothetical protein [Solirubrobacterales bacterium]
MPHVIAWCGFLGAWLLVAGPLDQAVREVEDQDFQHDAITEAASQVEEPPPVSSWWVLVPPVWYVLRRRREGDYRHRVAQAMDDRDVLAFLTVRDIVNAWAYVALGASLIAIKETWELHEAYEWPEAVFFALVVAMLLVCGGLTRIRMRHRHDRPAVDD